MEEIYWGITCLYSELLASSKSFVKKLYKPSSVVLEDGFFILAKEF
jgi:hypothetical protein